jgi:hypothetical protein
MKLAKLSAAIILLCLFTFCLVACDAVYSVYEKRDIESPSVELIYYDNPNASLNPSEKSPLNIDMLKVVGVLDATKYADFLQELSDIGEHAGGLYRQELYSHDGTGVRITYIDGSFDLITLADISGKYHFFIAEYDNAGNQTKSKGWPIQYLAEEFIDLLDKYFPEFNDTSPNA